MIPFDFDDEDQPERRPTPGAEVETDAWPPSAGVPVAPGSETAYGAAGSQSNALEIVRQYLQELSREELIALVERMAMQDAAVQQALVEEVENARGPTADLLRGARATIDSISAEAIYEDEEPGTGELARLRDRLETLIERGRADDVLVLCQRLLSRANRAVEAMEEADDGFFMAIHRVLEVIPEALARSSKPPVEQILWLHELELAQDYELLPSMAGFWTEDRPVEAWNELAARIEQRLYPEGADHPQPAGSLPRDRRRDSWASLLADALDNAGRHDEVAPLFEREAEITGNYERLVRYLLETGDLERAERWARRGISVVAVPWPGIASQLRQALQTIRERQGDLGGIAAYRAYDFFYRPGLTTYQELLASAEAAGVRDLVRRHALHFLETLILPWNFSQTDSMADLPPWPLPSTGLPDPAPYGREQPPLARVLLEVALAEGRLDDVLAWFDRIRQRRQYSLLYGDLSGSVARAVERSHPERAIAIWDELAAGAIARTSTDAYLEAARYLERSGRIEERRGNLAAWRARVRDLQARERRKWRLRQILDDLLKRFEPS
jgi:uncharacterized Zn finger protein